MTTTDVVRPRNTTTNRLPLLVTLSEEGIPRKIPWSATRNGPHFCFDFSELGCEELETVQGGQAEKLVRIGRYTKENPFSTDVYFVVVSPTTGIVSMVAEDKSAESEPIYLTSYVGQLDTALRLFIALFEDLSVIGPRQESRPAWEQFANDFRVLDEKAFEHPFSFWGNMISEQLQPD